ATITFFFLLSRLSTTIDSKALYYRFPPFVNKEKRLTGDDLQECYVRKYNPISEYGGWGYRIGIKNGKALNVAGKTGLQLVFKDGKKLLIGTQKEEEMRHAIEKLQQNWSDKNG
ncbi:MAG: hypothetical protein AAF616_13990, partial [Bacteroidota bacterium]